jgi:hypothetical protein
MKFQVQMHILNMLPISKSIHFPLIPCFPKKTVSDPRACLCPKIENSSLSLSNSQTSSGMAIFALNWLIFIEICYNKKNATIRNILKMCIYELRQIQITVRIVPHKIVKTPMGEYIIL